MSEARESMIPALEKGAYPVARCQTPNLITCVRRIVLSGGIVAGYTYRVCPSIGLGSKEKPWSEATSCGVLRGSVGLVWAGSLERCAQATDFECSLFGPVRQLALLKLINKRPPPPLLAQPRLRMGLMPLSVTLRALE